MSLPPKSIEAGKCYLVDGTRALHIRRVMRLMPDGRVQYESRTGRTAKTWKPGMLPLHDFASQAKHEVPCDWGPGKDQDKG